MNHKPPKDGQDDEDIWSGFDDENWQPSEPTTSPKKTKWEAFNDEQWVPDFGEAFSVKDKTPDVVQAEEDMAHEALDERWISGTGTQAVLMAAKKEHRFDKGKSFHGFVLEQKSLEQSEFVRFLQDLKESFKLIPVGTRIQLAIVTRFIDPEYEWSAAYEEGQRTCVHWTAVDLMVGEDDVSSFVLDAANSFGYQRMHDTLKDIFPKGKHYVYKREELSDGNQTRVSPIQTQERGCRVFTVEHLKQLSQIDSKTLYENELPGIGGKKNGVIHASQFSGHLKLTRIFRGMQTWTGLRALPEDMRNTVVNDKTGETLIQYAEKHSEEKGGLRATKTNETMRQKGRHYIEKKRMFYQTLSPQNQERIIEDRQGFTFLHHPQLFKLSNILSSIKTNNDTQDIMAFLAGLSKELKKIEDKIENVSTEIPLYSKELEAISSFKSGGAIKHEALLIITDIYRYLDKNPNPIYQKGLSTFIEDLYLIKHSPKNPNALFRPISPDISSSDDDNNSNDHDSNHSSPLLK